MPKPITLRGAARAVWTTRLEDAERRRQGKAVATVAALKSWLAEVFPVGSPFEVTESTEGNGSIECEGVRLEGCEYGGELTVWAVIVCPRCCCVLCNNRVTGTFSDGEPVPPLARLGEILATASDHKCSEAADDKAAKTGGQA